MSRPTRQGVDYFPLDVYLDDKFKFIQIKYKLEGFGVLIKLLQRIYSYGYWCNWTEDEALIFADENRAELSLIENVVAEAIRRGIFDEKLFNEYNILTSRGIQKRYQEIVKRRKDVEVVTEYLLTDNNFGVNVDIMPTPCKHNVDISTQSKVDKSKVDKSKVDKSKEPTTTSTPNKIKYGEFERVSLLKEEYEKLLDKLGQALTVDLIERLDNYKASTGKTYKSDYATILNWSKKEPIKTNKAKSTSNPFLEMMQDELAKGGFTNE